MLQKNTKTNKHLLGKQASPTIFWYFSGTRANPPPTNNTFSSINPQKIGHGILGASNVSLAFCLMLIIWFTSLMPIPLCLVQFYPIRFLLYPIHFLWLALVLHFQSLYVNLFQEYTESALSARFFISKKEFPKQWRKCVVCGALFLSKKNSYPLWEP
ncbi:MAG: hypothetical protein CW691_11815 [Candidatus Bathyarchaeum sp.]|nr:MAG: hypothetical protein CW691_11815 [Candidatus Bathyarchaeum sp.]